MPEKLANIYYLSLRLLLRIYVFFYKISKIVLCIIYSKMWANNSRPFLKIQDGRHAVFRKNLNITFQVQ